jgi:hypothetical protein
MTVKGTEVTVNELPQCQFCDEVAAYDIRTVIGPWAFVCQADYEKYGIGRLGTGFGQRLILRKEFILDCGTCVFCEKKSYITFGTEAEIKRVLAWAAMPHNERPLIQHGLPNLTVGQREQILNGSHDECFQKAFA